ncbi:TPA: type VI secretion system tip protein VgrG, partial [Enterobacter roggenkampii]|nr:type VI secretion system tip protein VgrG [Enterobacter roggenkampii]
KVEYGTTAMYMRKVKRTMAAGASDMPLKMPRTGTSHIYSAIYQLRDEQGNLLAGKPYKLTIPSGQTATGYTDEEGKTVPVYTRTQENVELHVVQKKPQPQETLWFIGDGSEQQMETELREQP